MDVPRPRRNTVVGFALLAATVALSGGIAYAVTVFNVHGTSTGTITVVAAPAITAVSWVMAAGSPSCAIGVNGTTFACTGVGFQSADSADKLVLTVQNKDGVTHTFTPQAPVITGAGGFITYTTPGQVTAAAGVSTTFTYTFSVSATATAQAGVSIFVQILES